MNSSAWNTKDGKQGDGTPTGLPAGASVVIPDATGAAFKVGDWTAGTNYNVGTTTGSFTVMSTDVIHLNEGINQWDIKVYGQDNDTLLVHVKFQDTVAYTLTGEKVTGASITASKA